MTSKSRLTVRFLVAIVVSSGAAAGALLLTGGRPETVAVEEVAAAVVAKNPFTDLERPKPGDERFTGTVLEMRPAGPYTYASLDVGPADGGAKKEHRSRWVVMLRAGTIATGDRVVVKSFGTQRAFRSRRLGMTFDELVFGVVRRETEGKEASR